MRLGRLARARGFQLILAAGIAVLSLCAAPALATTPRSPLPSPASTSGTAASSTPIAVRLSSISPVAPQPGDTVTIRGTLTNTTTGPVTGVATEVLLSPALIARSTLDAYADDPYGPLDASGLSLTPVTGYTRLADSTIGAGSSQPFEIQLPVDSLGLPTTGWSVHGLAIAVSGSTAVGTTTVGQLRTFLPWAPRSARFGLARLRVAWLWPLIDRPHRGVTPVWDDDTLAGELAPAGRLGRLVSAAAAAEDQGTQAQEARQAVIDTITSTGKHHHHRPLPPPVTTRNVPVTWVIDPLLIDDADAMRSTYQVAGSPKPTAGTGTSAARTFLADLQSAVGTSDLLPLPYADPDVTAAVRAGLGTEVGVAATSGRRTLQLSFGSADLLNAAWPAGGLIDERSVNALFSDGITALVLSDTALPPRTAQSATPSARAALNTPAGSLPTVLTDSVLSDDVQDGAANNKQAGIDLQRYLAETLMIEAESPSPPARTVVVAPGRRWSPSASYADHLLADTGKVPWLAPVSLGQVIDSKPDSAVAREALTYPAGARRDELPPSYLARVSDLSHSIARFADILPAGDLATQPYDEAVLRAMSSSWRQDPAGRDTALSAVQTDLDHAMSSVKIATRAFSTVTLTSHGGKLPVTVENDLDTPVSVTVAVLPNNRLTFSGGGRIKVTVPAHQHLAVSIKANAKTSGVFPLDVELLTPNGKVYESSIRLFVRSTVYGTITLVITGAATAALLIAVAIRLTRRAIAARRPAASSS